MKVNTYSMEPATADWLKIHGYDMEQNVVHGEFTYDDEPYTIVAGKYENLWFAEVEDRDETFTSDIDPNLAVMEALCMLIAPIAYAEEGNCEDAVNRTGYEVLSLMGRGYASAAAHGEVPDYRSIYEMIVFGMCMGYATKAVKFYAADMWEEF